jgi:phage portal protein BeeE
MLHIRDLSLDGIVGAGRAKLARDAIEVARAAERAQANIFRNGMISGGTLSHPKNIGEEAQQRLREHMEEKFHRGLKTPVAGWSSKRG